MSRKAERKGFVDCVSSPWVLLPVAAGWTLLMLAWGFDKDSRLIVFLGASGVIVGLGAALTQWLFAPTVDPELARRRQELLDSLAAAGQAPPWVVSREAERATVPAGVAT